MQQQEPITIFFTYAHEDEPLRDELVKQLSVLLQEGLISDWHDRRIMAGTELTAEISSYMETASIILLLISADFLASDYSYGNEMRRALERQSQGEATVIPILMRPCNWENSPFGMLQTLPRNIQPITTWENQEEAFAEIARELRQIIKQLQFRAPSLSDVQQQKPLSLFISYAHADEPLLNKLKTHLFPLLRAGFISTWHERQIVAGTDWAREIDSHLETASIILLLISTNFLASDYSYGTEMQRALERHARGEARVIPILLRPVIWEGAPFAQLQFLPRNGKPVISWPNRDMAYREIVQSIGQICSKFLQPSVQPPQQESPSIRLIPSQIYPLYDVFVKSGTPTLTFVEPADFEALQHALAQPGRGVVIEGPSGVGKTTAVEKAIERLAANRSLLQRKRSIQMLSARDPDHRRRLQTLRQWHTDTVIVDDFHRLDPALRQDLVDYLKYLADTSSKARKLVIVGIPRTGQMLVDASFDVSTRIDVFQFGHVPDTLIHQMVEKGEAALNILFDRKAVIALAANGSLNVAQFLCFNLCQIAQVGETCDRQQTVACDLDAAQSLVTKVLSRKFGEPIRRFAAMGGPRDSTSLLLLEELVNTEDGFLSLPLLKSKKPDTTQRLDSFLTEHRMEQLYREYPDCEQHFFFDRSIQAIVIDDPQLAFYLKQIRFSTLAKEAGKIATLAKRKVFVSYSHKDTRWLERLQVHLKPLEREGIIDLWDDTRIAAGIQWKGAIFEALETSRVAVLLISADFLASDFIAEHELPTLLTQAASGGTIILPVIVSPCSFHGTALSAFQTVNSPKKPLSALPVSEREQVLADVAEAVTQSLADAVTKQEGNSQCS